MIDKIITKHLAFVSELVKEYFGMTLWECALEEALAKASPEDVVKIHQKIEGWTYAYCKVCGFFSDDNKGRYCEHQKAAGNDK
jgi:hypothetical protein